MTQVRFLSWSRFRRIVAIAQAFLLTGLSGLAVAQEARFTPLSAALIGESSLLKNSPVLKRLRAEAANKTVPTWKQLENENRARAKKVMAAMVHLRIEKSNSRGSCGGFFIAPNTILTDDHCASKKARVTAFLQDGQSFPAALIYGDPSKDLALLRVKNLNRPQAVLRISDRDVEMGDPVWIFGSPLGLSFSLAEGQISALSRSGALYGADSPLANNAYLQVAAPINPGDSGGPVVNGEGAVIGIIEAAINPSHIPSGLGLALPAREIKAFLIEATRRMKENKNTEEVK